MLGMGRRLGESEFVKLWGLLYPLTIWAFKRGAGNKIIFEEVL